MSIIMHKKQNAKQAGFTLIEMMISLILGLFLTAVISSVFITNIRTNIENMKMMRLNQELRGVMTFMSDELKRAGYSNDPDNAVFMGSFNPVSATCILYSYDDDGDGIQDSNEFFGFRLDDTNEIRWARNATSSTCNSFGSKITDINIAEITTLNFNIENSTNTDGDTGAAALSPSTGVSIYDVTITLTGKTDLASSSDANDPSRTITETIRIRNEATSP